MLTILYSCCNSSKKEEKHIEQYLNGVVVDDNYFTQGGRNIHYKSYHPFGYDRSCGPTITIWTYEFNDTAISVSPGITTPKLALNLCDSFYLISVNIDYPQLDSLKNDIDSLIQFTVDKKISLPYPTLDSCGIVKDMRDWDWVAKFSKKVSQKGVLLTAESRRNNRRFSYNVKFNLTDQEKDIPVDSLEHKKLPPFLIYSLIDYLNYFGPYKSLERYDKDVYKARLIHVHDYFSNYDRYDYFNDFKYD